MLPLRTKRLILRKWTASDREPFAQMNADPLVTEYLSGTLTREASDALADRIEGHFLRRNFGLCAAELSDRSQEDGTFIGFIGLAVPAFEAAFTPCVEIGWRLAAPYWGRGLATEGAAEIARHAFEELGLASLVSLTAIGNARSRRVMEKIGMAHNPADDFDHPGLPVGHALRLHVLYRLDRKTWQRQPR